MAPRYKNPNPLINSNSNPEIRVCAGNEYIHYRAKHGNACPRRHYAHVLVIF